MDLTCVTVLDRPVRLCVRERDVFRVSCATFDEKMKVRSAHLIDPDGNILCRFIETVEDVGTYLQLGYSRVKLPRVHVRIVHRGKKIGVASYIKILSYMTIPVIVEERGKEKYVTIGI